MSVLFRVNFKGAAFTGVGAQTQFSWTVIGEVTSEAAPCTRDEKGATTGAKVKGDVLAQLIANWLLYLDANIELQLLGAKVCMPVAHRL